VLEVGRVLGTEAACAAGAALAAEGVIDGAV